MLFRIFPLAFCVAGAVSLIGALSASAQSSGGLSAATQLGINQAESDALYQAGQVGGSLVPKDTVRRCDESGVRIGGAPTQARGTHGGTGLPESLLDEVDPAANQTTTVVGNIYVLCQ